MEREGPGLLHVALASSVRGGPIERLARALEGTGARARLLSAVDATRWRDLMASGPLGRLRARLDALVAYPLRVVLSLARDPPDVVVASTNPFFLPLLCALTRPLHGARVVALLYDLWPDALVAGGLPPPGRVLAAVAGALNRFVVERSDGVVFIGRRMAEDVVARHGTPVRSAVIETGADRAEHGAAAAETAGPPESDLERWCQGKRVVSYVGNLGHVHDWDALRDAVPRLVATPGLVSTPALVSTPGVAFVLAASGPGAEDLARAWRGLPPERVRVVPPLDDRAWARLLARSDASIATLREAARSTALPSKALSALAAGCALVVVAPAGSDLADLVLRHACGRVVRPGDGEGLARAVRELVTDEAALARCRAAARQAAAEHYDLPALARRWRALLDDVAAAAPADPLRPLALGLKRALDVAGAAAGLALAAPVLGAAMLAVRASLGAPVLFSQERPGRGGAPFTIHKLRTMRPPRRDEDWIHSDEERLTPLGRLLRTTSVDELPELWNVLRGDMSLVGPRPLLMEYLDRYTPEQRRRHDVLPGITGWAQVNGRQTIPFSERLRLDVWYVDHWSLALDARILARTLRAVAAGSGVIPGQRVREVDDLGLAPRETPGRPLEASA